MAIKFIAVTCVHVLNSEQTISHKMIAPMIFDATKIENAEYRTH